MVVHRPPSKEVPSGRQVCFLPQPKIPTSVSIFLLEDLKVLHSFSTDRLRTLEESYASSTSCATCDFTALVKTSFAI